MTDEEKQERIAAPGFLWVCVACGKTSRDRYGIEHPEETMRWWDVSCAMNSVLLEESKLVRDPKTKRVMEVKE